MTRFWGKKADANQPAVIAALRREGYSVTPIHRVGQGCPDLLVGAMGVNVCIEIKDGDKPLTDGELKWHANWGGQVDIARSPDEAVAVVRTALWRLKK